jgi:hypothetical protein
MLNLLFLNPLAAVESSDSVASRHLVLSDCASILVRAQIITGADWLSSVLTLDFLLASTGRATVRIVQVLQKVLVNDILFYKHVLGPTSSSTTARKKQHLQDRVCTTTVLQHVRILQIVSFLSGKG